MAYEQNDLNQIQADVLMADISGNPNIPEINQLTTDQKNVLSVLNYLFAQTKSSNATASDAKNFTMNSLQNDEHTAIAGATQFRLSKNPCDVNNIMFFINGVKYSRDDFRYVQANNSVQWTNTDTSNHGFVISAGDKVSIVYFTFD